MMAQARRQAESSCSSTSVSPSLNFTLYGAPAPRSVHRTSSGAAKARPRCLSTKPTPPPPASPVSTSGLDGDDPLDFKLDLSSLAEDDHSCNYINTHQCNDFQKNTSLDDDVSIDSSELDESSQGFGDILCGNESYRSNSSSYHTLSEYSINYSASASSDDSNLGFDIENSNLKNRKSTRGSSVETLNNQSKENENLYYSNLTSLTHNEALCYKEENSYSTDNERGNSPELYVLLNDHKTSPEDLAINELYFHQERKCSSLDGPRQRDPVNHCVMSADSNSFYENEEYGKYSDEMVVDLESVNLENVSLKSRSNSEPVYEKNTSFPDPKTPESVLNNLHKKNVQPNRIYSAPSHLLRSRVSSAGTCNCNSQQLECLDSGYFPMTAGDIMEAVLYARQLVRVLENALDRAVFINKSVSKVHSSRSHCNRNKRSRSLSPNMLRHCRTVNGYHLQTRLKYHSNVNNKSDCEENISVTNGEVRNYKTIKKLCEPHVTPEELQKQRALLKPPTERNLQGAVTCVLDMADLLKNVILRRRKVIEPSEEFLCGTNRSVSEWSLGSTPRSTDTGGG